jgi:hypothetical protein
MHCIDALLHEVNVPLHRVDFISEKFFFSEPRTIKAAMMSNMSLVYTSLNPRLEIDHV